MNTAFFVNCCLCFGQYDVLAACSRYLSIIFNGLNLQKGLKKRKDEAET